MTDRVPSTDQQLAIAAKSGDRKAFGELARRFQPRLMNYLRHRCPNPTVAEDAIQEAFLAAFQSIQRFDPRWQISTWLFTIAGRKAGKLLKRCSLAGDVDGVLDFTPDASRTAEQLASDKEAQAGIWLVARDKLTHEQFTALWMYYVEGLDAKQTALILDKSYASARAILARARHAMRPHLKAWQPADASDSQALSSGRATSLKFAA